MNINWTTVFFQVINFLVIVWILKKYLFGPVMSAMENREKVIQNRLHEAEVAKMNAEEERKKLSSRMESLEHAKSEIMAKAYKKADHEYATMVKTFNAEMTGKRKAFEEQMVMERDFLRSSIRELAGQTILKTVSDALKSLASTDIQDAIFDSFIEKVEASQLQKTEELGKYYSRENPIVVKTSFELNKEKQAKIISAVSHVMNKRAENITFAVDTQIVCGIEIMCPPLLISYGMNTYVDELKINLDNGLADLTRTEKNTEQKEKR